MPRAHRSAKYCRPIRIIIQESPEASVPVASRHAWRPWLLAWKNPIRGNGIRLWRVPGSGVANEPVFDVHRGRIEIGECAPAIALLETGIQLLSNEEVYVYVHETFGRGKCWSVSELQPCASVSGWTPTSGSRGCPIVHNSTHAHVRRNKSMAQRYFGTAATTRICASSAVPSTH